MRNIFDELSNNPVLWSTSTSEAGACGEKTRQGEKINENVKGHSYGTFRDVHRLKSSLIWNRALKFTLLLHTRVRLTDM